VKRRDVQHFRASEYWRYVKTAERAAGRRLRRAVSPVTGEPGCGDSDATNGVDNARRQSSEEGEGLGTDEGECVGTDQEIEFGHHEEEPSCLVHDAASRNEDENRIVPRGVHQERCSSETCSMALVTIQETREHQKFRPVQAVGGTSGVLPKFDETQRDDSDQFDRDGKTGLFTLAA
jgi:hypothetical protein